MKLCLLQGMKNLSDNQVQVRNANYSYDFTNNWLNWFINTAMIMKIRKSLSSVLLHCIIFVGGWWSSGYRSPVSRSTAYIEPGNFSGTVSNYWHTGILAVKYLIWLFKEFWLSYSCWHLCWHQIMLTLVFKLVFTLVLATVFTLVMASVFTLMLILVLAIVLWL
jgi:hypothetical protein